MRGFWIIFLLVVNTACSSGGLGDLPLFKAEPTAYLPPTPIPQTPYASPRAQSSPEPLGPTPTPPCTNNLLFISDLTIPDGTVVNAGEELDKRWEIENQGTCNWDERYRIRLIAGPSLGANTEQAIFPARSGAKTTIRILFTAPTESGAYRSAWQAYTPLGEPFGDPFFVDFIVE